MEDKIYTGHEFFSVLNTRSWLRGGYNLRRLYVNYILSASYDHFYMTAIHSFILLYPITPEHTKGISLIRDSVKITMYKTKMTRFLNHDFLVRFNNQNTLYRIVIFLNYRLESVSVFKAIRKKTGCYIATIEQWAIE